jgi:hypothetical protein
LYSKAIIVEYLMRRLNGIESVLTNPMFSKWQRIHSFIKDYSLDFRHSLRLNMSKELAIEYIPHIAASLAKEKSKEMLYKITAEIKDDHECAIAVVTPFQRPFPQITFQSDDETAHVRVKSIGGNTVTLAACGNKGPIIVYLRVVDELLMTVRRLPL